MDIDEELQHKSEIADARLGVAEELGWPIAFLAGVAVHFQWGSWIAAIAAAIMAYWLATYRYRRSAAKAEDSYFRQAGLGKDALKGGESDV